MEPLRRWRRLRSMTSRTDLGRPLGGPGPALRGKLRDNNGLRLAAQRDVL